MVGSLASRIGQSPAAHARPTHLRKAGYLLSLPLFCVIVSLLPRGRPIAEWGGSRGAGQTLEPGEIPTY